MNDKLKDLLFLSFSLCHIRHISNEDISLCEWSPYDHTKYVNLLYVHHISNYNLCGTENIMSEFVCTEV